MKLTFDIEWKAKGEEYSLPTSPDDIICISYKPFGEKPFTQVHPKKQEVLDVLKESEVLIGHNIIGADLPALLLAYGIGYSLTPDLFDGHACGYIDTLVLSRYSYPDRHLPAGMPSRHGGKSVGPHSLAAWAFRVGMYKPEIEDWTGLPIGRYTERCEEDCCITEATYLKLMEELRGN